jgi:hypothetical protein
MEFKEGDKVKVITKNSAHFGRTGVVIRSMDDSTCFVNLSGDDKVGILTGFFVSELELLDPEREALITVAETLNKARLQAKPEQPHVGRENLTHEIEVVLYRTLMQLIDELLDVNTAFDAILAGKTVREALIEEEEE